MSSFSLAFFLYPAFISFLEKTRILDIPDNRKIHSMHTPSMGGGPMFIGAAFSLYLWLPLPESDLRYLIAALMLMFSIGLRDDLVPLPANLKLASQFIPFILLIQWGGFKLVSFYDLAPGFEFPVFFTWVVTLFVFTVITNSINLIDGLDGLAGTLSLIILGTYGSWFMFAGFEQAAFICFAIIGGLIAFLFFNWQPSRIFMGDTGALTLGLTCAAMSILFINTNYGLAPDHPAKITSGVVTSICILIVPLSDTLRVFIIRILSGRSPFSADTNHLHHLLIRCGFTHSGVVKILAGINLFFIGFAYFGSHWSPKILLMATLFLASSAILILSVYVRVRLKTKTQKAAV